MKKRSKIYDFEEIGTFISIMIASLAIGMGFIALISKLVIYLFEC